MPTKLNPSVETIVAIIKNNILSPALQVEFIELLKSIEPSDSERQQILNALNEQSQSTGKTGWQRVLEWSPTIPVALFDLVAKLENVPTQFIAALAKPDKEGYTAVYHFASKNQAVLSTCLMLIDGDANANKEFSNLLSQSRQGEIRTPWLQLFDKNAEDCSSLIDLVNRYPDEAYAQFKYIFTNFNIYAVEPIINKAKTQPVTLTLLSRLAYDLLFSQASLNDKHNLIIGCIEVKSAIINYILNLPEKEKSKAINIACTAGTSLNLHLAQTKDFIKLEEIYYGSKETASVIQALKNKALLSQTDEEELLALLKKFIFNVKDCSNILIALKEKDRVTGKTNFQHMVQKNPALLLPLLHSVYDSQNLPEQLVKHLALADNKGNTGWDELAISSPALLEQCLKISAENEDAKNEFRKIFAKKNKQGSMLQHIIFDISSAALPTLEKLYPEETYSYFLSSLTCTLKNKNNYIKLAVNNSNLPVVMNLLSRFSYESLVNPEYEDKYTFHINMNDNVLKSAVISHILALPAAEKMVAIKNACLPDSKLYKFLVSSKDFSRLTEIYYYTKETASLVQMIRNLPFNEKEAENLLNKLNDHQFSSDELNSIFNTLKIKTGYYSMNRTGWDHLAGCAPSFILSLLRTIGKSEDFPIQLVNALTEPDNEGNTTLHAMSKNNHTVLEQCLTIIAENHVAKEKFWTALTQQDRSSQSPWKVIFNTFQGAMLALEKHFPEQTYVQFSNSLTTLNLNYKNVLNNAQKQPIAMALLGRFVYENIASPDFDKKKYQLILDDKEVKAAVIAHILTLPDDEKSAAIKNACTLNSPLNQLLANANVLFQLMKIYYFTKETASLVRFIQNPDVNNPTIKGELLEILNTHQFSSKERDAILNALNMKTDRLNRSGWHKIATFASSLLLPLLQKMGEPENLPTQLINILAELDTRGNTPLHTLANNDPSVFIQCLEIIAENNESKVQFLRALSQVNQDKFSSWAIIFKDLPPVLSKLEELYPDAVVVEMENYFKSSSFNKFEAELFMSSAVNQPSTMALLTRFLYYKLTVKTTLNSKYITFVNNLAMKSSLIQHILHLSEAEQSDAWKEISNKKSNLYLCLSGHKDFKLLINKLKAQKEAQKKALLEVKRAKSLSEKAQKKARNEAKNEARLLAQPSKRDINAEKESIYHNLVKTVHDAIQPVIAKIEACCNALDQTTESGKILAASERSFSSLLSSKPDTLSLALTLIKEDLIPQIKTIEDAKMLKTRLTVIQRQLKLNNNNNQVGQIIARIEHRCQILASLPTDINLHDMTDNASIEVATEGLKNYWSYLYSEISNTTELFNSADKKTLQGLLTELNRTIISPLVRINKETQALDHHYAIQVAAVRFNHCPVLAKFAGNPKMEKTMNIVSTLADAKTLFDMRDFLYKEATGLSIVKVEPEINVIQIREVKPEIDVIQIHEVTPKIKQAKNLAQQGMFKSPVGDNDECPKEFLSKADEIDIERELEEIMQELENDEKNALPHLEADKQLLMRIQALGDGRVESDEPVETKKEKSEDKTPVRQCAYLY